MAGEFEVRLVRVSNYLDVAERMGRVRAGDEAVRITLIREMRVIVQDPEFLRRNAASEWRVTSLRKDLDRWEAEGPRPPRPDWDLVPDISYLGETAVLLLAVPEFEFASDVDKLSSWNFAPFADGDGGLFVDLSDDPWIDKMMYDIWHRNPEWPRELMDKAAPAIALYPRAWLPHYVAALEAFRPKPECEQYQRPILERHRDLARRAVKNSDFALSVLVLTG